MVILSYMTRGWPHPFPYASLKTLNVSQSGRFLLPMAGSKAQANIY
jgi:hypothetical protein